MDSILNVDDLLLPISLESPSGDDLRYTAVYDQIKEARREDDRLEQGEWLTEVKTSDWRLVSKLCCDALTNKTKDLQIGVWLTEALVHQHGYAGLCVGLEFIMRLVEDFWPTMHPLAEEGDLDYRVGPLLLLDEKLPSSIYRVPVCDPRGGRSYHYYQWKESLLVGFGKNLDKEERRRRESLLNEGKISGEDFAVAVNSGSLTFYLELSDQLTRSRYALSNLDIMVTEKFAPNPPGFRHLRESIDACALLVGRILKDKQKSEIVPEEDIEFNHTERGMHPDQQGTGDRPGQEDSGNTGKTSVVDGEADIGMTDLSVLQRNAIIDVTDLEKGTWKQITDKLSKGLLKPALDQVLSASALAPSQREKNRYLIIVAKLCLKADRADLASPIVEDIYARIGALNLEQWEHPAWIAEVVETLYRCLQANNESESERGKTLFRKLCMLNAGKAAAYRTDS